MWARSHPVWCMDREGWKGNLTFRHVMRVPESIIRLGNALDETITFVTVQDFPTQSALSPQLASASHIACLLSAGEYLWKDVNIHLYPNAVYHVPAGITELK